MAEKVHIFVNRPGAWNLFLERSDRSIDMHHLILFFVQSEMFFFQFKREPFEIYCFVWFYTSKTKRLVVHLHTHLLKLIECVWYRIFQVNSKDVALTIHVKVLVGFPGTLHFHLYGRSILF